MFQNIFKPISIWYEEVINTQSYPSWALLLYSVGLAPECEWSCKFYNILFASWYSVVFKRRAGGFHMHGDRTSEAECCHNTSGGISPGPVHGCSLHCGSPAEAHSPYSHCVGRLVYRKMLALMTHLIFAKLMLSCFVIYECYLWRRQKTHAKTIISPSEVFNPCSILIAS